MSETKETKVKAAIPAEVLASVAEKHAAVDALGNDIDLLLTMAKEEGLKEGEGSRETTNPTWLARKLKYHFQSKIYAGAGIVESPVVKERKAKVDAGEGNTPPSDKPGRKRMNKQGTFKLDIEDANHVANLGRESSARGLILRELHKLSSEFTVEQFNTACEVAMGYDQVAKTFARDTKFATIEQCQNAWFSQLVNKDKAIVRVQTAA